MQSPVLCVGDLMVECVLRSPSLPARNRTLIVDGIPWQVGGSAFNMCWYFQRLGRAVRLVAPYGRRSEVVIKEALRTGRLDSSGLVAVEGDTDSLLTVWSGDSHRSIYIRARLPKGIDTILLAKCHGAKQLIVAGSRHRAVRKTIVNLIASQRIDVLGFNPSYAVYEFQPRELAHILKRARVTVLNEQECKHVCKVREVRRAEELARYVGGILIVTRGGKGARVYYRSLVAEIGSLARESVFSLGAGDAFFAGFLHMFLRQATPEDAARFASAMAALVVEFPVVRVDLSEQDVVRRLKTIQASDRMN